MASRMLHLAVAEELLKMFVVTDRNRFRAGCILPDACNFATQKSKSHLKIIVDNNSKKTYDLDRFRHLYAKELIEDDLYKGYYLHLICDLVFRNLMYGKYQWDSAIPGNVARLHNDFRSLNLYTIKKYGIKNDISNIQDLSKEKINLLCSFDLTGFLVDMADDFNEVEEENFYFFTRAMADEFVSKATEICAKELYALAKGEYYVNAYEWAWVNK